MKYIGTLLMLFLSISLGAETLWDDGNADIYARKIKFRINDSLKILIDEKSALDYKSTVKSVKSYSVDVKSDNLVGVFELVPQGSIDENKNAQEKDTLVYTAELQAQIVEVYDTYLSVRGVRNIAINNKNSRVEITGDVAFKDISGSIVRSSDLMNQTLKVTTVIDNTELPVSADDFIETTTGDATGDLTGDAAANNRKKTYSISDEKKKELLLNYLNKILNVVF